MALEIALEITPEITLEITPLDAPLGAMVRGWNPKRQLSAADLGLLRQAMREHLVLVLRGHAQPTDAELVRFGNQFGELVKGSELFGLNSVAEILRINNVVDENGKAEGLLASSDLDWHADYSFMPVVGKESFLEAVELPRRDSPPTSFCSQYAALDRLPRAMLDMLRPVGRMNLHARTAFHNIKAYKTEELNHLDTPDAEHPIILRHPDNGREILYVNRSNTRRIAGMPEDESNDLLNQLYAHQTQDEYVYHHQWQVGDFVVFDTLGTQHRRSAFDPSERRIMRQLSTMWETVANAAAA
jgi:alpha-ketoglutarate-dependent taurine dioxygenase